MFQTEFRQQSTALHGCAQQATVLTRNSSTWQGQCCCSFARLLPSLAQAQLGQHPPLRRVTLPGCRWLARCPVLSQPACSCTALLTLCLLPPARCLLLHCCCYRLVTGCRGCMSVLSATGLGCRHLAGLRPGLVGSVGVWSLQPT